MDTTVIGLCLSMFDWARFRRAKGAVKLHMLLDHDGYLPVYAHITDGKTHEIRAAKEAITRNSCSRSWKRWRSMHGRCRTLWPCSGSIFSPIATWRNGLMIRSIRHRLCPMNSLSSLNDLDSRTRGSTWDWDNTCPIATDLRLLLLNSIYFGQHC